MKYFSYISNEYSLKNNLEKDIYAVLVLNDRQVIDEADVEAFKAKIISLIDRLNQLYPRCKPCKPHWYTLQLTNNKDVHLQLSELNNPVCNFHLYASKN